MEIQVKKEVTETRTIQLPLFFKSPSTKTYDEFVGVFSEEDVRTVVLYPSIGSVHLEFTKGANVKGRMQEWLKDYDLITEDFFLTQWQTALKGLCLLAQLTETV